MKKKISKIMGIGLAFVVLASLMTFAIPVSADPYNPLSPALPNMWEGFMPTPGGPPVDLWWYHPDISQDGPMAKAINGNLYIYVQGAPTGQGHCMLPDNGDRLTITDAVGGDSGTIVRLGGPGTLTVAGGGGAVITGADPSFTWSTPTAGGTVLITATGGAVTFSFTRATRTATAAITIDPDGDAWFSYNDNILMSSDGGRTWAASTYPAFCTQAAAGAYNGGPVVDMVCSELYEDVCYATDGYYVYKTVNGGITWAYVAPANLEYNLMGKCGLAIITNSPIGGPITCIDVGYDGAGKPIVFIGTRNVGVPYDASYPVYPGWVIPGSVYWIADESFPAEWHDLQLRCYSCCNTAWQPTGNTLGCYDVYAVGCAPDFSNSQKTYAVITTNDNNCTVAGATPSTRVVYNTGVVCSWFNVSELCWDCVATNNFEIIHASRIMFPDYYSTNPTLFVGVTAWNRTTTMVAGGDVYRVSDTVPATALAIDLNVQGFISGCVGIYHANICSLDYLNDKLVAGAWDSWQLQSPTRVYYSGDGGWTWTPSLKDPTGTDHCYVLFGNSILAATRGCDCAVSLSCEAPEGAFFNQISLINMDIEEVLDLSHAPGYVIDSSTMYVLTYNSNDSPCAPGSCTADAFSLTAAGATTPTIVETNNTDLVNVTVLTDVGTLGNIGIAYAAATRTWTITFAEAGDAVLVTALADDTQITLTYTTEVYAVVDDCDGDLAAALAPPSPDVINMDDGLFYGITSLLRWDGTYWERVHSSRYYFALGQYWITSPLYDWVEVSPDFNETSCLYLANTNFDMARSLDAGCSWAPLTYPCYNKPTISAWIVVDLETVLASAAVPTATGNLFKTTYHGSQPWGNFWVMNSAGAPAAAGVDFDLSPSIATDNSVLLGDANGQVYLSQDVGETWAEIEDILETGATIFTAGTNTYVVFDPGYGTAGDPGETMIYAAAGAVIGRCGLNFDALWVRQDWVRIDDGTLISASGIDVEGDTALYVADRGAGAGAVVNPTISGTIAVSFPCAVPPPDICTCDLTLPATAFTVLSGAFTLGEPVSIIEYNLYCATASAVSGSIVVEGLISGAIGTATVTALPIAGTCGTCPVSSGVGVISSHLTVLTAGSAATSAVRSGVLRSLNPMDPMPPAYPIPLVVWERLANAAPLANPGTLEHPQADAFGVFPDDLWLTNASNVLWALDSTLPTTIWMWEDPLATSVILISDCGTVLTTTDRATLEWNALDNATMYEVMIFSFCATCPNNMELFGTFNVNPLYYCADGVCCWVITGLDSGTTYFWQVRVALGSPYLSKWSELCSFTTLLDQAVYCSPACGAEDITLTPNFSWYEVVGAASYEIEVSLAEDFATLIVSGTPTINAWDGIPELEYGTTYYWRVRAIKADGTPSDWTYCLFSTMEEPTTPAPPITPVTIVTEEITPAWIWVIIGIGAALVIAVIVLIVTTRRVS
jgi:hypothetical protein